MSDPRLQELRQILANHEDNELQGHADFEYVIQHLAECAELDAPTIDDIYTTDGNILCPCCGRVL